MLRNTLLVKKKHWSSKSSFSKTEKNTNGKVICWKIYKKNQTNGIKRRTNN